MPAPEAKATKRYYASLDNIITAAIGKEPCGQLDVRKCAEFIEAIEKLSMAKAVRSRLSSVCKRGMQLGWMEVNPAQVTAAPKYRVLRKRLTLETFMAIFERAPEVCEWLPHAMRLALVTGADRSTISSMERKGLTTDTLSFKRHKTGVVEVPLRLRLDVVGWSLSDVVAHRTGVVSRDLLHHVNPWANAPAGSAVHVDCITNAFAAARDLTGIDWGPNPPTFHEIRSLAKRLYTEQRGVDTKALLGHQAEAAASIYTDPRGSEPMRVSVK